MVQRNWLPTSWLGDKDDESPFGGLRKQIDSLFDEFDGGLMTRSSTFSVRTNVSETDDAIRITAELPGIEMKDIDVSVTGNRIVVQGQKQSEKEEKGEDEGREFHRVERSSGAFHRSMTLPFDIDPEKVEAATKDGVLTVTVPKPPEAVSATKRVEIKKAS